MTPVWSIAMYPGLLLAFTLAATAPEASAQDRTPPARSQRLTSRESAEHAIDRLTFGARPDDVESVQSMGAMRWIDQQLHPEKLDDSGVETRLAALPAMRLSTDELIRRFPPNPTIRQLDAGKIGMPTEPVEHAIYASALAGYRERRENKADQPQTAIQQGLPAQGEAIHTQPSPETPKPETPKVDMGALLRVSATERWTTLLSMPPGTARPFLQQLKPVERQQLVSGMTPEQKEDLLALVQPARVVEGELMQQKLLRAVYSNRQLQEVMTDFWFNHFNIYIHKNGEEPWYVATYERDVIRPHALGRFEDLLSAVAHSPAMLIYLDNQQSIGPHSMAAMRAAQNPRGKNAAPGLNENYARELMELHTLGVNGGYTQRDVTEVARVFTGWGVDGRDPGHSFEFNPRRHEPGTKLVMGRFIREGGEQEGAEVLHMLATSPATARFLSTKLATRFVSDTPPPALVDRMTKTYLKTHGEIRQVLRTMFRSPEFWSRDAYRAKLKTPLEFVASSLRATDANIDNAAFLTASLERLGMPLYGVQQPNGYSLKGDPWLGAESLLARLNFALALTSNRIPGVRVVLPSNTAQDSSLIEAQLEQSLLDGRVNAHTHETVVREMETPQAPAGTAAPAKLTAAHRGDLFAPAAQTGSAPNTTATAAGLLLGSPDFQRR
ncbi:MAG: DUF1800 domain-containing protein [Silvibacterium sp.]|nr:DUF1800 domain-containing protein [Silvibacterium sp.]